MTGYVYAIQSGDLVKIGWSAKPWSRFTKLRTDNPERCTILGARAATREQEAEIHGLLAPAHVRGEWFRMSPSVAAFVDKLPPCERPAKIFRYSGKVPKHPITAYRERECLTIGDLADRLKVDRVTVWRWEAGKRRPEDKLLATVSELTGIPIAVLMNLEAAA